MKQQITLYMGKITNSNCNRFFGQSKMLHVFCDTVLPRLSQSSFALVSINCNGRQLLNLPLTFSLQSVTMPLQQVLCQQYVKGENKHTFYISSIFSNIKLTSPILFRSHNFTVFEFKIQKLTYDLYFPILKYETNFPRFLQSLELYILF